MKRVLALVIALILVVALFAGCTENDILVGTWVCEKDGIELASYTFNEDGTGTRSIFGAEDQSFTYTLSGSSLTVTVLGKAENYSITADSSTLTLTGKGDPMTFTKQ